MAKTKIPPIYRDPVIIRALSIETWVEILKHITPNELSAQTLTYTRIIDYLISTEVVDEKLHGLLKRIHDLGNPTGRLLIEQAAEGGGDDLVMTDEESDEALVARIWIASQTKTEWMRILSRAETAYIFNYSPKVYKEFAGDHSFADPDIDSEQLKKLITEWCLKNNKKGVVDIFVYHYDNTVCCAIVRGDPRKNVAAIENDRQEIISYIPCVQDHISIEPETGKIRILTNSIKLTDTYREILGELLVGSSHFFTSENICTLAPLLKSGSALFVNPSVPEIRQVALCELTWIRGDRDRLNVKGRDCFKLLKELELEGKLTTGTLTEAKLRFDIVGESRPVFATIKPPRIISTSNEAYQSIILKFLDQIGLRGNFDIEDPKNFWQLSPWHFSETQWRKYIKNGFDYLKSAGCLQEIPLNTIRHPENDNVSGVMQVEHLPNEGAIAVSSEHGLRVLTSSDIEGYKLNRVQLINNLKNHLGLNGTAIDLQLGVWRLGELKLSDVISVQIFLALESVGTEVTELFQQHGVGIHSIAILPKDCRLDDQLYVCVDLLNLNFDDVKERIVCALDLVADADPARWCREELVIDRIRGIVWFDGVKISMIKAGTHEFRFLVKLAENKQKPVYDEDMASFLTGSKEDAVVRRAKSNTLKAISDEYKAVRLVALLDGSSDNSLKIKDPDAIFKRAKPKKGWLLDCTVKFIA